MKIELDSLIKECRQEIGSAKAIIANAEQKLVFVIESQSKQEAQLKEQPQKLAQTSYDSLKLREQKPRFTRVSEILPPKNSNKESSTTNLIINNHNIAFTKQDNQIFCTSLDVARVFEKRHTHILDIIKELQNDTNIQSFTEPNFRLCAYKAMQTLKLLL